MAPQQAPNHQTSVTSGNDQNTPATVIVMEEENRPSLPAYIPSVILPISLGAKKDIDEKFEYSSESSDEDDEDDNDTSSNSQASIVVDDCSTSSGSSTDISSSGSPTPSEKHSGVPHSKRSVFRKYRGLLLAILSSFIFSVSALLVKKLETYDPFNSALYKFQGALLPAIPLILQKYYCSKKGPKVVERVWPLTEKKKAKAFGLVLLRSVLTCNALLLHFFSLKYLPISDALTISAATPIFVNILAKVFLGEKCGFSTIIASVCSLLGVVAIAKPPFIFGSEHFNADFMIGSGLAFGCTVLSATSFITLRYIRKVHYSVTTLMYGTWGTIENLAIILIIPSLGLIIPTTGAEWCLIIGLAALTLFGQLAIILAMKAEKAGPIALVKTSDVLFAFIFDIAILKRLPDLWSLIGAAVIVLSVVFVGLRKWVKSYPRGHPLRAKFRFIIW